MTQDTKLITISDSNSEEEQKLLSDFFRYQERQNKHPSLSRWFRNLLFGKRNVFHKNRVYRFTGADGTTQRIKFSQDIIRYAVIIGGQKTYRYYVLSENIISKGNFGKIKKVEYEVKHKKDENNKDVVRVKKKSMIAKMQQHRLHGDHDSQQAKQEAFIQRLIRPNATKVILEYLSVNRRESTSYILDQDLGQPLGKINPSSLTLKKYLQLCINALYSLKKLHDKGFVHHDIKPQNILIDEKGQVHLIDFGLSQHQQYKTQSGTRDFAAPEAFLSHSDMKSDIYSLGLTLLTVAGAKGRDLPIPCTKEAIEELVNHFKQNQSDRIDKTGFNDQLAEALPTISNMLHFDPSKRGSIDELIEAFSLLQHKTDSENQGIIAGLETSRKLSQLPSQISHHNIEKYQTILLQSYWDLSNQQSVIGFTKSIKINALTGLTTKEELEEETNKIINKYLQNIDYLNHLKIKLNLINLYLTQEESSGNKALIDKNNAILYKIDSLFYRIEKRQLSLDSLKEINQFFVNSNLGEKSEPYLLTVENKKKTDAIFKVQLAILDRLCIKSIRPDMKDEEALLTKLKNKIIIVVTKYITKSYTKANIKKQEKALSESRSKAIEQLLDAIEKSKPRKDFIMEIRSILLDFIPKTSSKLKKYVEECLPKKSEKGTVKIYAERTMRHH